MHASDTSQPLTLDRESKFTLPLAFLLGVLVVTATGVAVWTTTRAQVERNTERIRDIETEQRAMRDTLAEIRGDVKYLVRDKQRREEAAR